MISLLQQTANEAGKAAVEVANGGVAAVGSEAAAAGQHATGMPQLDSSTFANQIFWLVLTVLAIWWVLTRIALPRIASLLADRQHAISADIEAAEALRRKARESEAIYDAALARARSEAQEIAAKQKDAMQADIDAAIAEADADIAARSVESDRRIAEIRADAIENARAVARDVTGDLLRAFDGSVDEKAVAAAVDRRLQGAA